MGLIYHYQPHNPIPTLPDHFNTSRAHSVTYPPAASTAARVVPNQFYVTLATPSDTIEPSAASRPPATATSGQPLLQAYFPSKHDATDISGGCMPPRTLNHHNSDSDWLIIVLYRQSLLIRTDALTEGAGFVRIFRIRRPPTDSTLLASSLLALVQTEGRSFLGCSEGYWGSQDEHMGPSTFYQPHGPVPTLPDRFHMPRARSVTHQPIRKVQISPLSSRATPPFPSTQAASTVA
ncbi:hypothetical protein JAAARDRAFT_197870 [Jaapia argillacea MUCL 33604]|uniref:Uncharacterized protein n=1 Tax=Jaapia argillacea MUCL 33604 TaxID=933084 RepID=A0A067PNB2_9AGAM|nr:hypothetical protein JAAARDRAFT_197870 [Jaapia argillacea MUCL 33604]